MAGFSTETDRRVRQVMLALTLLVVCSVAGVWYYCTPKYTRVGYTPGQPVPFSHDLHAGQLGMSCLYCHTHVDESSHSNIPATQTCLNCHSRIKPASPLLADIRESAETGLPVRWEQVHKLPDFAYFNHAVHVGRGVSCVSCHGKVNEMRVVTHDQPMSMAWCLECHRNPAPHLRPADQVANLDWKPPAGRTHQDLGEELRERLDINPPVSCQACHR